MPGKTGWDVFYMAMPDRLDPVVNTALGEPRIARVRRSYGADREG